MSDQDNLSEIDLKSGSVSGGGFVAGRDQKIEGDVISVSNVGTGAAVAAGRDASARVQQGTWSETDLTEWRAGMEAKIEMLAELSEEDKKDLKVQVTKIAEEAAKGKKANPGRLAKLVNVLSVMAPDIFEVAVATLANPLAGIGLVLKKVGDKAEVESQLEK